MTDHPMPAPPESPQAASRPRGLIRWVSNHNPFYVVSAVLVLLGLRMSVHADESHMPTWALLTILGGYTLLLAATACVLVWCGNVWEDVRTLMLLVVLGFLAISVFFDDILVTDPRRGAWCCAVGLAFASAVSEGVLRGMRVRLPLLYKVPYHLMLALFFLYPAGLAPLLRSPGDPALLWGLYGFAAAGGLVLLTLLPAVRRGPSYVASNGTPWRWPLYPWVCFGLMAVGVCGRAYYLCLAGNYTGEPGGYVGLYSSIFGPYFLVPILLAVSLLLLEAGLSGRRAATLYAALIGPAIAVVLSGLGHRPDPVYTRFLVLFTGELGGTPLYLAAIAAAAFYAVAALRGASFASGMLSVALGALAVVGPGTLDLDSLSAPRPVPLLAIAALQLTLALRRRSSVRSLAAATCLVAAATAAVPQSWTPAQGTALAFHLALGFAMLVGALFDDFVGRALRGASATLLALACLAVVTGASRPLAGLPLEYRTLYPMAIVVLAAIYGRLVGDPAFYVAASVGAFGGLSAALWHGYAQARRLVAGLDQLVLGLASFVLAALISLAKAGVLRRWYSPREEKPAGPLEASELA